MLTIIKNWKTIFVTNEKTITAGTGTPKTDCFWIAFSETHRYFFDVSSPEEASRCVAIISEYVKDTNKNIHILID